MSIFYSDRYDEYGVPHSQKKFNIRMQDLHRSPATKSGRPLKPDAVPGAIVDYLNAYRIATQAIHARAPPQYQLAQHIQPGMYSTPGVVAYQGRMGRGGGGRGGGSSQKDSSGNCGIHSMWWWGSDILDTGTPPGARQGAMGNPAPLVNMLNIYPKYNIIFDKGTCYSVEADNGIAKGARKPVPCSVFNHGGFAGYNNMAAKLTYRKLWETTQWAANALDALFQGASPDIASVVGTGFARGGGGGNNGGQRMIQATIAGKTQSIAIDTGTDAILMNARGNQTCVFPPNPQSISIPGAGHTQANYYYVPAWSISQRIKICLTNEYTVCQSLGTGGTIAYHWSSGNTKQNGDPYNGKEWGETNAQSTPAAPAQQKGAPNYTQPIAKPEGQQNQYFNKKGGWGYGWEEDEDDLLL